MHNDDPDAPRHREQSADDAYEEARGWEEFLGGEEPAEGEATQ
jgi:hypothetical protein